MSDLNTHQAPSDRRFARQESVDPTKLRLERAKVAFFRAPNSDGKTSRHYAIVIIPHPKDETQAGWILRITSGTNWRVARVSRLIAYAALPMIGAVGRWLTRPAGLPSHEYVAANAPWYLDPKRGGIANLREMVAATAQTPAAHIYSAPIFTVPLIEAPQAEVGFQLRRRTERDWAPGDMHGQHRIRVRQPDGRVSDFAGRDTYLRNLLNAYGGPGEWAIGAYCCPSTLRALGAESAYRAVDELGADLAFRRGLAPRRWTRHGDTSETDMPDPADRKVRPQPKPTRTTARTAGSRGKTARSAKR